MGLFSKKWNPEGKHAYVTGGSTGLGLSLAQLLVKRGAHVSIVARNEKRLAAALESLEALRVNPSQNIKAYSHSLDTAAASEKALDEVCQLYDGVAPDIVFNCAGASRPGFFVEMSEQDLTNGMKDGYWVQAWTAWAAAKKMAKQRRKGAKIVFVASTLAYMSFVGWASYSPAKHALRGLADTLRSEMLLYGVDVHIHFPNTMFTPGFEEENKTKPDIVRKIEEGDDGTLPGPAAEILLNGVQNGHPHIVGDLITALFSASTRGSAPRRNWLLEGLYDFVAYIAVPVWRSGVDKQVTEHGEVHYEYLAGKGFFA
ncbi:hypothetical protein CVT24_001120 [Panaeolus cyanescens]|uniref:3-dehydrosphinganine reductase n=1 Tax=Panaeolus cyanescens TaxID=181874 RepID=A0A409YZ30_9AGAR|nr:hypothetical protein CVT24_001120 [Panaeolus cyanescens]